MPYTFQFDATCVGSLRLHRKSYQRLNGALKQLRDEVESWNARSAREGGAAPYRDDVDALDKTIDWGTNELAGSQKSIVVVTGISVGTLRYMKAALRLEIERREAELSRQTAGWPQGAAASVREDLASLIELEQSIEQPPADILAELWSAPDKGKIGF